MGVASSDLLPGSAAEYGKERSGADWQVVGVPIFIEVTGPLKAISAKRPLWIRPDKLEAAEFHRDRLTWVVHCSHDNDLMRTVYLDQRFFVAKRRSAFKLVEPRIRGNTERYYEIPADSGFVRPFGALVDFIRQALYSDEQVVYF